MSQTPGSPVASARGRDDVQQRLRTGRLRVELVDGAGADSVSRFTEECLGPDFEMSPGDGRLPYVDLQGDRSVQVAFQPDVVRILMDDVFASVHTNGIVACSHGSTVVTIMPDGSVRVAKGDTDGGDDIVLKVTSLVDRQEPNDQTAGMLDGHPRIGSVHKVAAVRDGNVRSR